MVCWSPRSRSLASLLDLTVHGFSGVSGWLPDLDLTQDLCGFNDAEEPLNS